MKKTLTISLLILSASLLSACGLGYTPDRSYMTPEQIEQEQQKLDEALQKYDEAKDAKGATDDISKIDTTASVGFHYMNLGDYGKAIDFYKEVIKLDYANFPALNNLAVMYEEMGEIDKAIEYQGELYNYYIDNAEVNSDFIRLLLANKQFEEAGRVVEAYKLTEKGAVNVEFVKSLEKSIEEAEQKSGQ